MNTQKYILPATIAAAIHAALLCSIPDEPIGCILTKIIEVPLAPVPKPPDDVAPAPPEEKLASSEPVRPLAGGPTPPVIPDSPVIPIPDVFVVPIEPTRVTPTKGLTELPKHPGIGDAGPHGSGDWSKHSFFSQADLDNTPRAKMQRSPDYPALMKQQGVGGSVTVEFDVNTRGEVIRAEATRYTHREFVEPALRAVRSWRFEPGRRDGRVVAFRLAVPIEFGIEGS